MFSGHFSEYTFNEIFPNFTVTVAIFTVNTKTFSKINVYASTLYICTCLEFHHLLYLCITRKI